MMYASPNASPRADAGPSCRPLMADRERQEVAEHGEGVSGLRGRMLARLDDRERAIISLRFGLEDGEPLTLREVGSRLGLTLECARELELRAVTKLK